MKRVAMRKFCVMHLTGYLLRRKHVAPELQVLQIHWIWFDISNRCIGSRIKWLDHTVVHMKLAFLYQLNSGFSPFFV